MFSSEQNEAVAPEQEITVTVPVYGDANQSFALIIGYYTYNRTLCQQCSKADNQESYY